MKNFNSDIRQSRSQSYRPTFLGFYRVRRRREGRGEGGKGGVLVDGDDDLAAHRVRMFCMSISEIFWYFNLGLQLRLCVFYIFIYYNYWLLPDGSLL